jgi:hypothetical protein
MDDKLVIERNLTSQEAEQIRSAVMRSKDGMFEFDGWQLRIVDATDRQTYPGMKSLLIKALAVVRE